MKLEQEDIYDIDTGRWYKIERRGNVIDTKRLNLIETKYTNVTKFPTGNHLYYSNEKGLHYKERSSPPPSPRPEKISVSTRLSEEEK